MRKLALLIAAVTCSAATTITSAWLNLPNENLTAGGLAAGRNTLIWKKAGVSDTILLMPMEPGTPLKDYSDSAKTGTISGTVTCASNTGWDGHGACTFDGSTGQISVPSITSSANAVSVEAWVYITTFTTSTYHSIVDRGYTGSTGIWSLYVDRNSTNISAPGVSWSTATSGGRVKTSTNAATRTTGDFHLAASTWHHIVGTFSTASGKQRLYVDGVLVAQDDRTTPLNSVSKAITIGNGTGTGFLNGKIDDVAIYNRELTAAEISQHYQQHYEVLHGAAVANGDVWTVCAVPNDGSADGTTSCSDPVTIAPSAITATHAVSGARVTATASRSIASCSVQLRSSDSIYRVSVPSALRSAWLMRYPVTYVFSIPAGSSSLTAYRGDSNSGPWTQLTEKTTSDFFNGIEAVRFDYTNNRAYVSAAVSTADSFYLRFPSTVVSYVGTATYYDNRHAAYSLSIDNWRANTSAWSGMQVDSSDTYRAAAEATKLYNIPPSIGIITGAATVWTNLNAELAACTSNWCWEPASHSVSHSCDGEPAADYASSKATILANLTNIPYGQQVYEWIAPCGAKSSDGIAASAGQYLFFRDWDESDHATATTFAPYNPAAGMYGPGGGGIQTVALDPAMGAQVSTSTPIANRAVYDSTVVSAFNAAWDATYAAGGIHYEMFHPDRYNNSVIYSTTEPGAGTASSFMQHLSYVSGKTDVWYVANGWLYLYKLTADNAVVSPSAPFDFAMSASGSSATYSALSPGATYSVAVRCVDGSSYSAVSTPASVTIPSVSGSLRFGGTRTGGR